MHRNEILLDELLTDDDAAEHPQQAASALLLWATGSSAGAAGALRRAPLRRPADRRPLGERPPLEAHDQSSTCGDPGAAPHRHDAAPEPCGHTTAGTRAPPSRILSTSTSSMRTHPTATTSRLSRFSQSQGPVYPAAAHVTALRLPDHRRSSQRGWRSSTNSSTTTR